MELSAYLHRIRFDGSARPDLATLNAIHRAHQYAIPFENLDVLLRRPLVLDLEANYNKIVCRRRGGWCYEMNGVMEWALRQIGFEVMRMSAGVMRVREGDAQLGNHLCLLVCLDQRYLVDVGFGGSLVEPLPLRASEREDRPYRLGLSELDDSYWRFAEIAHGDGDAFSFDFRVAPADEALFARKCQFLQTDPASPLIQNLVVQRRTADTHLSLRGRVLQAIHATRVDKKLLNSADELVATLRDSFDLDTPEAATLWPSICARHELSSPTRDLVIHYVGPFQGQDYGVANAALAAGAHYLNLADRRQFLVGFAARVNDNAGKPGRLAISGGSTLPALSSAVVEVACTVNCSTAKFGPG